MFFSNYKIYKCNLSPYTWIFQVCKICAFSPKKPTKRQKFYIYGRSRYDLNNPFLLKHYSTTGPVNFAPLKTESWMPWPLSRYLVERAMKKKNWPYFPLKSYPIPSMYGIFAYIWLIFMVNVGKYTIHGWYGYWLFNRHLYI